MLSYAPTLRGSTLPRVFTRPLVTGPPGPCGCGCALTPDTSLGFSAVQFAEHLLGAGLLPWQRWLLIHALELRAGTRAFRYRTIVVMVARQNGKTTCVEIKNLWKLFVLRVPLVIGTAQNLDISEESWDNALAMIEGVPELKAELTHVDRANGKKSFTLADRRRYKVAVAGRKGGRGLSGDDVNLDELREHHTWEAWAAVTKTTLARSRAQVWAFSNAGDDRSVVLNGLQAQGRAATEQHPPEDTSLGHFEWSAPDEVTCTCGRVDEAPHAIDCQLRDRRYWVMANPSLGYTITAEAIESALSTDPTVVFRTEVLCQRVRRLADPPVIGDDLWHSLTDVSSRAGRDVAFAVDVEPNQRFSAILVYSPRPDGFGHLEVVAYRRGIRWLVPALVRLRQLHDPVAVALDDRSPARALLVDLARHGITVPDDPDHPQRGDLAIPGAADVAGAWQGFLAAVNARELRHLDQAPLTAAVGNAKLRKIGESDALARRASTGDICPLVAATLARWAFVTRVDLLFGEPELVWL